MPARRTSPRLVGALAGLLVTALSPLTAAPQAGASPSPQREVGVASYNLFLGGNIGSLVDPEVDTVPEFIAGAAALWQNVVATDFPARAEAIADLLAEDHPDVVGLQEVANWATTSLSGAPVPSYDFQELLLDALAERGTPYRVIASNTNFVSPTVPIPPLGLAVQFTDRDVVIARADLPASQLKAANPRPHTFEAGIPVTLPVGSTRIIRGWSTVDVKVRGKTLRFTNTHLEAFSATVRNLQAAELAESLAASPHPVVLVGDLNSQRRDEEPEGDDVVAYETLTSIGLADAWIEAPGTGDGDTSGQTDPLTNVPSLIDHRIDYVLYEPDPDSPEDPVIDATEAHVIGEELADRATSTVTGAPRLLWPSDHAGVVATLHIGRP